MGNNEIKDKILNAITPYVNEWVDSSYDDMTDELSDVVKEITRVDNGEVLLLFITDEWLTHSSNRLLAGFTDWDRVIDFMRSKLSEEDLEFLRENSQTQGLKVNYIVLTEKLNPNLVEVGKQYIFDDSYGGEQPNKHIITVAAIFDDCIHYYNKNRKHKKFGMKTHAFYKRLIKAI